MTFRLSREEEQQFDVPLHQNFRVDVNEIALFGPPVSSPFMLTYDEVVQSVYPSAIRSDSGVCLRPFDC